jgi:hypothetical protein
VFGAWMARRRLSVEARQYVARKMSGRTLTGGGLGFVLVALAGLALPTLVGRLYLVTPIHVHNLHDLGAGFVLAVPILFGVAAWAFFTSIHEVTQRTFPSEGPPAPVGAPGQ